LTLAAAGIAAASGDQIPRLRRSGGGQHDHFTLAISHNEDQRTIIDLVRGVGASAGKTYDPHESSVNLPRAPPVQHFRNHQ